MPATPASQSPSDHTGELGLWIQAGEQMVGILPGQKRSPSSSSSKLLRATSQTPSTSGSLGTTEALSKGGGEAEAATPLSTKFSGGYMSWSKAWGYQSTQSMSCQLATQQTRLQEEYTRHGNSSSHPLRLASQLTPSLQTSSWVQMAWTESLMPHPVATPQETKQPPPKNPRTTVVTGTMNSSSSKLSKREAILANVGISNVRSSSLVTSSGPMTHHGLAPNSPLRPPCQAKERLCVWRPVESRAPLDGQGQPGPLTQAMLTRVEDVLQTAWAPSTADTYGTGLAAFHWFCDEVGVAEADRAPASRELLEVFAAALAGVYSPSTISNYLAGVRAWHIIHGLDLNTHKPTMEALLKAATIMSPPDARRAERPPLRLAKIGTIRSLLDLGKPLDSAVFACLTTTFWGTARLGKFALPDKVRFDVLVHIPREAVRQITDKDGNVVWVFKVPRTKTEIAREDIYWAPQPTSQADPLLALQNHLQINNPPAEGHLFAYKHGTSHRPLRKKKFLG
jgi:hypothetical protein